MVGVRGALGITLAVAALVLAWALLAIPAFADAKASGGTLQYVDCDQVRSAAKIQYNAGNSGGGDVNQELHINQNRERACLSGDSSGNNGKSNNGDNATDTGATESDQIVPNTVVEGTLPDTGGLSLSALGTYALVVTGLFSLRSLIGRRRR